MNDQTRATPVAHTVAVKIDVPQWAELFGPPLGEPCPDATVGGIALTRMIEHALRLDGVFAGGPEPSCGASLRYFCVSYHVSDLAPALEVLQRELETVRLLSRATIAWRDDREGIWRVHYPRDGFTKLDFFAEIKKAAVLCDAEARKAQVIGKKVTNTFFARLVRFSDWGRRQQGKKNPPAS